ncbi:unnamed protein product [Caenorhabditis bovis]|uniref:Uncharacterized protein n=1 Tax=Caenorhabditis bovis TaxID=2654633 RepID=A0A8S1EP58_9PELO|nr:unnamed protein product [Caenorhabditis bovis]
MMSRTEVIIKTQELVNRAKAGEDALNDMLSRANKISERIRCMRNYKKTLDDISEFTVNGHKRKNILDDLQRENKKVMALENEVRQLRCITDECLGTIRDVVKSHNRIKKCIETSLNNNEADEIDNVLMEMSKRKLESKLRKDAMFMNSIMNDLEKTRFEEEKKELLDMASLSNPAAPKILKEALRRIEMEDREDLVHAKEEEDDLNETVLNSTIVRS